MTGLDGDTNTTLTKPKTVVDKKIPVMEIFGPTIQGEGIMIGVQTYFIRFGLCDYKCTMCDSMHAVDPASVMRDGQRLTQDEIFDKFVAFHQKQAPTGTRWITFSGGNPCIHDLSNLVAKLNAQGFLIAVETQGTMCPPWLMGVDVVTISPKGPGMGERLELDRLVAFVEALTPVGPDLVIKVVVFDERDLEVARLVYERLSPTIRSDRFFLSLGNPYPPGQEPKGMTESYHNEQLLMAYRSIFDDIKTDPILSKFRFLPQWHTFVWGNAKGK